MFDKDARRNAVASRPSFEKKRFRPSSADSFRELVGELRAVLFELKFEYPEVVTLALFGSRIKGYERPDSDIDLFLIVDGEIKSREQEGRSSGSFNPALDACRGLLEKHGLLNWNLKCASSSPREIIEDVVQLRAFRLTPYFLPCIDKDAIFPYRQLIIEKCLSMNSIVDDEGRTAGERCWNTIMEELWRFENTGFEEERSNKRRALYKFSLQKAKEKYLGAD